MNNVVRNLFNLEITRTAIQITQNYIFKIVNDFVIEIYPHFLNCTFFFVFPSKFWHFQRKK